MIIRLEDYNPNNNHEPNGFLEACSELLGNFLDQIIDNKLSYLIELFDDMGGFNEFISFLYFYSRYESMIDIYVYVESDKIVGFAVCKRENGNCTISYLAVKKEYRNKKIGFQLMEHIIDSYQTGNFYLFVSVNNENAIKLYLKFNFVVTEIKEHVYADEGCGIYTKEGCHAYEMVLHRIIH